jgi:hypothetical protein
VELLLSLTESPSWKTRRQAARELGAFPTSDLVFRQVLKLLERDRNREVRTAACLALRIFHRREAIAFVIERFAPLRGRDRAVLVAYLEWASGMQNHEQDEKFWPDWWERNRQGFRFPER